MKRLKMKVAISGASGFLGSWIARVISSSHEVIAITRQSSDVYRLSDISNLTIVNTAEQNIEEIFSKFKPDALIVSSWWGVSNTHRNNERQSENLSHTLELGTAAKKFGVKRVIGVGSQAELGPISDLIYDNQIDSPTTLYGLNKVRMRNQYLELFNKSDVEFKWLRIFSTYGPLDSGNWLIPSLVDSISKNTIMDLTLGEQSWSYLHAYDLGRAFQKVLELDSEGYIFNVGNPQTIKIKEAAMFIANELGRPDLLNFGAIPYRPDQVMSLQPVCESLKKLGWKPEIDFKNGVKQTIDWLLRKSESDLISATGNRLAFTLPIRP